MKYKILFKKIYENLKSVHLKYKKKTLFPLQNAFAINKFVFLRKMY